MPKLTTHQKLGALRKIQFTKEGYRKLLENLEELKNQRPAAVKELARARELGDLSENGLYTAAKARLGSLDSQIFRAEMTIKFAEIVEIESGGVAQIGSKVTVKDEDKEITYEIVGDTEANPKENKITKHSPLGRALVGKKVGDHTILEIPAGKKTLIIQTIT